MPPEPEQVGQLLHRLYWTVFRPIARRPNGDERSLVSGQGLELAGLREYQPGDDVRRIDWNVTARSDRPFVREARTDRALDVWLVVDLSASVDWGTALCLKRDRAIEIAAVIAQLVARHGNRVGVLAFADQTLGVVPPGRGRLHLELVVSSLRDVSPTGRQGTTDLSTALREVGRLARRPGLLVLVSDFLVPDGWAEPLRGLAHRHEVVAVRVHDPREASLPDAGILTLEDPETGEQLIVDTADRRLRERFSAAADEQQERIRRTLQACGVDLALIGTDEPLLPALLRFIDAHRLRGTVRASHARSLAAI
jgi:uncharacterized protein (DUF58 family)